MDKPRNCAVCGVRPRLGGMRACNACRQKIERYKALPPQSQVERGERLMVSIRALYVARSGWAEYLESAIAVDKH